tara:strand:- start:1206 stop:2630 length:1425 start_codon:yes stop_codon:yes gene_type:complete
MKAISLFSGMGGDSLGIKNAGIKLVAYSEWINDFQKTHDLNFKDCELLGDGGDINNTKDEEFLKYKGKVDLIFAGFPCQGFSNGGKKLPDDPRNTLFREFHRAAKLIEPKYIIGENVKGLLTKYIITTETLDKFYNSFDNHFSMESEFSQLYNYTNTTNIYKETMSEIKEFISIIDNKTYDINRLMFLWGKFKTRQNVENTNYKKIIKKCSSNKNFKATKSKIHIIYDIMISIFNKILIGYIDVIKNEFSNIGYNVYCKVMKCSLQGIPQNRERLIIVGIKKYINKKYEFPPEKETNTNLKGIIEFTMEGSIKMEKEDFNFDTIPKECIITDMNNDETEQNPHPNLTLLAKAKDFVYKTKKQKEEEKKTKTKCEGVTFPRRIHFGKRVSVGGEIIDIRKPINTIICSYSRIPRFFVPLRNKNGYYLRCLTPNELKQIQGFPKDYKMSGDKNKQIIQIGNAVPPPLITQVIKSII